MAYYDSLGGNKYRLCVQDPKSLTRKRLSLTVVVPDEIARSESKTERWLLLELAKFEEKVESGDVLKAKKMTMEQFIPVWKKGAANQVMGGYTLKNTTANINCHLLPAFGSVQLDQIKTIHLVTYFADLIRKDGKPMATNTKLNIFKAAKSLFDAAFEWKLIRANPMDGVKRPTIGKKEKKEMKKVKKNYNWDEVETLLIALYKLPTNWRLYFTGLMMGGFRRGELLAVEWNKLDYVNGAIYVENQITFDEDGNVISGEVKTEESEDWVPMPMFYMEQLKLYRREWAKEKLNCPNWQGGDKQYIFHSGDGTMFYPTTPTNKWGKFLVKIGLDHLKLHGLRHTAGMLLRESGADLKTIQEQLRHTKIQSTEGYTHKSNNISRAAIDRLESLDPTISKSATRSATLSNE